MKDLQKSKRNWENNIKTTLNVVSSMKQNQWKSGDVHDVSYKTEEKL